MGTAIVLIVLILIVSAIVKSMIKKKKEGKCITCDGDCAGCAMGASHMDSEKN